MLSAAAILDRLDERASAVRWRISARNPVALALDSTRRFVDVRASGLAAEMTYYALLSLIPLATALGAGLGLLEPLIGSRRVDELESTLISQMESFFSTEVVDDVMAPLVESLLGQQRNGIALGSLAVSVYLASRIFRAAIRALDDAYEAEERRTLLQQFGLALGFLLASLVAILTSLGLLVLGPLLGVGTWIADRAGAGAVAELAWTWGRWPAVALVVGWFLTWLYRSGPNVENTWRQCLPGAVVATIGLGVVAVGFQLYLRIAGPTVPDVGGADQAVVLVAQLAGVALAAMLLIWLLNIMVLVGGVVNAEWRRHADDPAPSDRPEPRSCDDGEQRGG